MATRIDTPTAVPDLFGPGKNGFTEGPPATEFSPAWCNNVQEEICRVVEAAGLVVDPLNLGQMAEAIGSFPLVDPTLTGTLTVENGATIDVLAGGTIMADPGSSVDLSGSVTIGGTGSFTCIADASFSNDVTLGDSSGDLITVNGTSVLESPAFANDGLTMNSSLIIAGASGGSLATDPSGNAEFNGEAEFNGRCRLLTGTSVGQGDLSQSGGVLRWRDSSSTRIVHYSDNGWVKGHGQMATLPAAASISVDTSSAVAPVVASDLDVVGQIMVQRAVAGDVIVSLIEVGGAGQIQTNQTITVNATPPGNNYQQIVFSRTRVGADTTPRVYRFEIDGNGSNVNGVSARVTASSTS